MSKKFRILKDGKVYVPQKKIFGFIWVELYPWADFRCEFDTEWEAEAQIVEYVSDRKKVVTKIVTI